MPRLLTRARSKARPPATGTAPGGSRRRRSAGWIDGRLLRRIPVLFLFGLGAFGCGSDSDTVIPPIGRGDSIVLTSDLDSLTSVEYTVDDARIDGLTLRVDLTVSGGCSEHTYQLFISKNFAESFPVQTWAYIVHEGEDPCDGLLHEELSFDLTALVDHYKKSYGGSHDPIIIHVYMDEDRERDVMTVRYEPVEPL